MESSQPVEVRRPRRFHLTADRFFLIFCLLVGGILCIAIPFGAGFDEETHLARIWEISGLRFLPNQTGTQNSTIVPRVFFSLSYQRRYFLTPADDLLRPPLATQIIDRKDMFNYSTRSIYPPVNFLPQALVLGVGWRLFDWPVVPVAILARMAGLLVYALGAFIAIRWIPAGKWVMALLAISPMALFQASTLNADGFTNAISFLLIGYTLKLLTGGKPPITKGQALALAGLVIAIGFAKQGAFVILPLLLVLPYGRFPQKRWFALIWGAALVSILLALGWSALVIGRSGFVGGDSSSDLIGHIRLALANPVDFLTVLVRGVYQSIDRYFHEWVGVYGHWLGAVPDAIYWLYPVAILAGLASETRSTLFSTRERFKVMAAFLVASGALATFFYLLYYQVGATTIMGVQGRYLTSLTPMLYLPLAAWMPVSERSAKVFRALAITLSVIVVGLYGLGLYATYYSQCSMTLYTGGPCYQPIYKNLDKVGSPIVEIYRDQQLTQTFVDTCGLLEGAQVWVKSIQPELQGSLTFELLDNSDRVLASQITAEKDIPAARYLTLAISPPVGKTGSTYKLRLSAADTPPGEGVKLAYSDSNQYHAGVLALNGQALDGDLIFKYMCVNSWKQVQSYGN